jgi:hypothetical protein
MNKKLARSCLAVMALCVFFVGAGVFAAPADQKKPKTLDTDPNLAGRWTFDDGTGESAPDSSKHGRDGVLKGGLAADKDLVPGKTGKALRLDGQDDYVEIGKYKGVTGTRPRTVAAWIKTAESKGEIASWGADDYGQMWTFGFIGGRVGVTPNGGYLYMNEQTHDDKWHHVAVVVKEAEMPNLHDHVRLYRDGALAEIHDIGLLDLWPIETGHVLDVRIGRGFKGLIDRALSDDEMSLLFKLESNRPKP